jgi:hypothetical protein
MRCNATDDVCDPQDDFARPIALLALPNTGTDWLVDLILRQNSQLHYYREFFNPICNSKYEDVLGRAFGCETLDSYEMIARPQCPYEDVYQYTWAREDYNFTKENYSAFKAHWFVQRFRCFVLNRRIELSLPGGRLPVKTWYSALYWSLVRNRASLEKDVRALVDFAVAEADTVNKRQVAAYTIYYYQLLQEAKKYGLPVVDYDDLLTQPVDELAGKLHGLPGVVDAGQLARDICTTRRHCPRDFASLGAEEFSARLGSRVARLAGDANREAAAWHCAIMT